MRKETGILIIQYFDHYGHKEKEETCESFIFGKSKAMEWEHQHPGNSVVIMRVMYNTKSNNDKW